MRLPAQKITDLMCKFTLIFTHPRPKFYRSAPSVGKIFFFTDSTKPLVSIFLVFHAFTSTDPSPTSLIPPFSATHLYLHGLFLICVSFVLAKFYYDDSTLSSRAYIQYQVVIEGGDPFGIPAT